MFSHPSLARDTVLFRARIAAVPSGAEVVHRVHKKEVLFKHIDLIDAVGSDIRLVVQVACFSACTLESVIRVLRIIRKIVGHPRILGVDLIPTGPETVLFHIGMVLQRDGLSLDGLSGQLHEELSPRSVSLKTPFRTADLNVLTQGKMVCSPAP